MFGMTFTRSRSYSSNGGPGAQASSHTEIPRADDASLTGHAASPGTKYRFSSKTP